MNKEEIYYKKTPISEPPKENGKYFCLNPNNVPYTPMEVLRYEKYNDSWHDDDNESTEHPAFWLKPVEVVDPGQFAEWCSAEGWDIIEYSETDEAIWMKKAELKKENDFGDVKTTSELRDLFKEQFQKVNPAIQKD